MSLFSELRRRKVFRVAAVYAATAFVVLQAAELVLPRLGVPDWAMSFLVAVVLAGFPIALVLAWALEVTPEGGLRRTAVGSSETSADAPPVMGKRTLLAMSLLVVLGVGLGAGWLLRPGDHASAPAPVETASRTAAEESVAVLPFVALSSGEDDGYFADGLTEEILNSLASVPDLLVTARTSSFYFKDKDVPLPQIAEQLGVAHVVEGSVRRAGDEIRVTAQLIRAEDGFHLWSQTYDRPLDDVFEVQADIAEKVAGALSVYLDDEQRAAMALSGTRDVEAFEAFLKGRALLDQAHASEPGVSLWDANEELERAMALDPTYVAPAITHHDAFAHYLMDGPDNEFLRAPNGRGPSSEEDARRRLLADLDRAIDNARTPTARIVAQLNKEFFSPTWTRMPALIEQFRDEGIVEEASAIDIWLSSILLLNGELETMRRLSDYNVKTNPLHAGTWSQRVEVSVARDEFDVAEEAIDRGRALAGDHPWLHDDELFLAVARRDKQEVLTLLRRPAPILAPRAREWRAAYLAAVEGDYERATQLAETIDAQEPWPQEQLLRVYHETGDTARARALTQRIDALAAGPAILARTITVTASMLFFDIADAPNFSARLADADIDPASFRPMPRLSVAAGTGEK